MQFIENSEFYLYSYKYCETTGILKRRDKYFSVLKINDNNIKEVKKLISNNFNMSLLPLTDSEVNYLKHHFTLIEDDFKKARIYNIESEKNNENNKFIDIGLSELKIKIQELLRENNISVNDKIYYRYEALMNISVIKELKNKSIRMIRNSKNEVSVFLIKDSVCYTYINTINPEEYISIIKSMGCNKIYFGYEIDVFNINDNTLKYPKDIQYEKMYKVINRAMLITEKIDILEFMNRSYNTKIDYNNFDISDVLSILHNICNRNTVVKKINGSIVSINSNNDISVKIYKLNNLEYVLSIPDKSSYVCMYADKSSINTEGKDGKSYRKILNNINKLNPDIRIYDKNTVTDEIIEEVVKFKESYKYSQYIYPSSLFLRFFKYLRKDIISKVDFKLILIYINNELCSFSLSYRCNLDLVSLAEGVSSKKIDGLQRYIHFVELNEWLKEVPQNSLFDIGGCSRDKESINLFDFKINKIKPKYFLIQ